MLSNDIYDYYNVSQGKITIPNVDDGEECEMTDVSVTLREMPGFPIWIVEIHRWEFVVNELDFMNPDHSNEL